MVQSIQTIAHESYHVLGFYLEATAECYGMQSLWYAAHRLGASVEFSQALAPVLLEGGLPAPAHEQLPVVLVGRLP